MISEKALNDKQAVSLAEAIATANEIAQNAGVLDRPVRLMIEEELSEAGAALWRINYLPVTPPDRFLRGGDYTVEVDAVSGSVYRTLQGQ